MLSFIFFFASRRRHTRCALVTGVQTCALPIYSKNERAIRAARRLLTASTFRWFGPSSVEAVMTKRRGLRRNTLPSSPFGHRTAGAPLRYGYYPWPKIGEHSSELQSLMLISYAVFCLKKKHPFIRPTAHSLISTC